MNEGIFIKYKDLLSTISINSCEEKINKKYRSFVYQMTEYCSNDSDIFSIYRMLKETEFDLILRGDKLGLSMYYSKLKYYINTELEIILHKLNQPQLITLSRNQSAIPNLLHWTDDKIDLVELIYAIKRSVNNGEASIKRIALCFEFIFQVKLGNIYDTFSDLNTRMGGATKFLDTLPGNLMRELDRLNA